MIYDSNQSLRLGPARRGDAGPAFYAITAAGGPAFVIVSGLLVPGISVNGLIGRVLPRGVTRAADAA